MDHIVSTYAKIAQQYAAEFSHPTDDFDDFLALLPLGADILDVGCGPGVEIAHCRDKGFAVEGIDLSREMIEFAKAKNPDVKISCADILEFQPLKRYDGCIASYSLIHLSKKDMPKALSNIRSYLKQGGYVYIAVHEGPSLEKLFDEPFNRDLKIFLNIVSEAELVDLLVGAGFEIRGKKTRDAASPEEFSFKKLIIFAQAV